jgi:chorismate synthase
MLRFLTAGESHGPWLTIIVEGMPAGLALDEEKVDRDLARRQRGYGRGGRMKIEQDRVEISSGLHRGLTIGSPIAMRIMNRDWENWRDREWPPMTVPRPGHADLAGARKYGLEDARPILERASARETAARVAAGGLARLLLAEFGISVGSHVIEIGGVRAEIPADLPREEVWCLAEESNVRCPDEPCAQAMRQRIDEAREAGDSLGGVIEIGAIGVPVGLGSHVQWDRRLDSQLAAALMGIQAIKGIEIGPAFKNAAQPGTRVHDEILPPVMGFQALRRGSNRAGGIEGGISNGQPIVVRAAMKPIPTTISPLRSVDLATGEVTTTQYQRSDVCAVPAASIVGEAAVAWTLAKTLMEKVGGDSLAEMRAHAESTWGGR